MAFNEPVMTKRIPLDPAQRKLVTYDQYVATGGYVALRKALDADPRLRAEAEDLLREVFFTVNTPNELSVPLQHLGAQQLRHRAGHHREPRVEHAPEWAACLRLLASAGREPARHPAA